jgi:ribosome biogenesis GTPase A
MPVSTKINWFPGHMNRARREIAAALRKADVVIELVDARLPRSSRNPILRELAAGKPVLTLLAKADLADPEVTEQWLATESGPRPLALATDDPKSVRAVPRRCRELAPGRGGPGRTLRAIVVGIPNVGKSTLINTLLGRRIAKVGDRPAITRKAQRVELDADLSIFDSPGVLWPRLDDQTGALRLAASGAIGEAAYEPIDVAGWAACFLADRYRAAFSERFGLDDTLESTRSSDEARDDSARAVALLEAVGRRRGALRAGGHVDLDRAADVLLRDLRSGRIGRISLERPDDFPDEQAERPPLDGGAAAGRAEPRRRVRRAD